MTPDPLFRLESQPTPARRKGLSRPVWLLVAFFLVVCELATLFAGANLPWGWDGILMIMFFTAAQFVAVIKAV